MKRVYSVMAVCTMLSLGSAQNIWLETTQEDFRDGTYERNLYASNYDGGTVEFVPNFDMNNDGYIDLFTADASGPYVRIYWGSAAGFVTSTLFPTVGADNCDAADLDGDGYADFVVSHRLAHKISIYWGGATGPDPYDHFDINTVSYSRQGVHIADLNKDGYLDIVTGHQFVSGSSAILWGSASGYGSANRTDLPVAWSVHNIEVADLDKDGWLDILFANYLELYNVIYWGSAGGFLPANLTLLANPYGSHGTSVADLNGDGHLDLIFTAWDSYHSFIYWGSATGYSNANVQILSSGNSWGGSSVAHLNADEHLDIVFHRGGGGAHPPVIVWGSSAGYSMDDTSHIGTPIEATGGLVADLNGDGHLDVFCNAYNPGPVSPIFWGPSFVTSTDLAVSRDHHAMFREIGNVYSRQYYEDYSSSVFDAGADADWGVLEWEATTPTGASVLFWVRSGQVILPDSTWSEWQPVTNGGAIPEALNARFLQYRARLGYANPCYLPALNEVRVTCESAAGLIASLRITPETINLQDHGKFTAFITMPAGYDHRDIDVSTVCCHGAGALSGHATPGFFIAKFNVQDLVGVTPGPAVEFVVTGQLFDSTDFVGYDTVRVIGVPSADIACHPNPFKTKTTISIARADRENVRIKIYDVSGKLVRTFDRTQWQDGAQSVEWDRTDNAGRKVSAGVYLFRVEGTGSVATQKIIALD